MPLAVVRKPASELPVKIALTDEMAVTPRLHLSSFTRVKLGAHISHSGQALKQPGDLYGEIGEVEVGSTLPVALTIDKVEQ